MTLCQAQSSESSICGWCNQRPFIFTKPVPRDQLLFQTSLWIFVKNAFSGEVVSNRYFYWRAWTFRIVVKKKTTQYLYHNYLLGSMMCFAQTATVPENSADSQTFGHVIMCDQRRRCCNSKYKLRFKQTKAGNYLPWWLRGRKGSNFTLPCSVWFLTSLLCIELHLFEKALQLQNKKLYVAFSKVYKIFKCKSLKIGWLLLKLYPNPFGRS